MTEALSNIDREIILPLTLAKQYCHHASFAGLHRQAIANGYSAIDAVFSALLRLNGIVPPRNHKEKLEKTKDIYPNLFEDITEHFEGDEIFRAGHTFFPGCSWNDVEEYYDAWLLARYEEFTGASQKVGKYLGYSEIALDRSIRTIANYFSIENFELEKFINLKSFGYEYSKVNEAISDAHMELFDIADQTESLSVKMNATTNFCNLDMVVSDTLSQQIICENAEIANYCANLYRGFTDLIERVQYERYKKLGLVGLDGNSATEDEFLKYNTVPDFFLSLKAIYHGMSHQENASKVAMAFAQVGKSPKRP